MDCWLPGRELPEPQPLDHGGFDLQGDALGFSLGVDRERALFGLIPESVDDIDRERAALDTRREPTGPRRKRVEDPWEALLPKMGNDAQLDMDALWEAVATPEPRTERQPVVTHRRRVA